jgi:hypothetical protein
VSGRSSPPALPTSRALIHKGIVAKCVPSPYRVLGNVTPWLTIRNSHYTQSVQRH